MTIFPLLNALCEWKLNTRRIYSNVWVIGETCWKEKNWAKDYGYKGCTCHNKVWYVTWIVSSSLNNYNLVLCPKIKRSLYNLHLYFYFEQGHTIDRWWKLQIIFSIFWSCKEIWKNNKKTQQVGRWLITSIWV